MLKAVLLEESVFDEPTEDEVMLYAESLGIDVEKEQDLLYIAKEGISAHLPTGWQVLKDENNQIFYYDSASGISLWEHPLDRHFRDCVLKARQKKQDAIDTTSSSGKIPHDKSVEAGYVVSDGLLRPHSKSSTNNKETARGYASTRSGPHEGECCSFLVRFFCTAFVITHFNGNRIIQQISIYQFYRRLAAVRVAHW
ncbi:unnamed protein product [Schistosoma margrebowiei]|uniref:Uncharacterized protein n=1 Tax=Schistosoma margrebowiei TaxID=48269 RepID=A0A183LXF1_9TREM|nr:unnamed protein product [Schistosoma margrebowiei]